MDLCKTSCMMTVQVQCIARTDRCGLAQSSSVQPPGAHTQHLAKVLIRALRTHEQERSIWSMQLVETQCQLHQAVEFEIFFRQRPSVLLKPALVALPALSWLAHRS
eukprot:jgi/Bigna1/62754/fgenesh1_kg.41_\